MQGWGRQLLASLPIPSPQAACTSTWVHVLPIGPHTVTQLSPSTTSYNHLTLGHTAYCTWLRIMTLFILHSAHVSKPLLAALTASLSCAVVCVLLGSVSSAL